MKKLLLFLFIPQFLFAQLPDSIWSRVYGGEYDQRCVAAVQTSDGGYILAGNFEYGERESDFYIVRVNADGDSLWSFSYGGDSLDICTSLLLTPDGGFLIGGSSHYTHLAESMTWVVKFDSVRIAEWSYTWEQYSNSPCQSISRLPGGNYLIAGYTLTDVGHIVGHFVHVLSSDGLLQWSNDNIGWTDSYMQPCHSIPLSDTRYFLAGANISTEAADDDFQAIIEDSSDVVEWSRTYGGPHDDRCTSAIQTSDGGYLLAGWTQSFGIGDFDWWILKLSSDGDSLWSRTFGEEYWDQCTSVVETATGFLLCGTSEDPNDGNLRLMVVATDFMGEGEQIEYFGGTHDEENAVIVPTSDNGFAFAGTTRSFGGPGRNFWLLKTAYLPHIGLDRTSITFGGAYIGEQVTRTLTIWNTGGVPLTIHEFLFPTDFSTSLDFPFDIAVGQQVAAPIIFAPQTVGTYIDTMFVRSNAVIDPVNVRLIGSGLAVNAESPVENSREFALLGNYPNPFNNSTRIDYSIAQISQVKLTIWNALGEQAAMLVDGIQPPGAYSINFSAANLASGIYLCRLETPAGSFAQKMMLLK